MTPEEREQQIAAENRDINNAKQAKDLKENEYVKGILVRFEKDALDRLLKAQTDDERRTAQAEVLVARKFAKTLVVDIERGDFAENQRSKREKAEEASRRANPRR